MAGMNTMCSLCSKTVESKPYYIEKKPCHLLGSIEFYITFKSLTLLLLQKDKFRLLGNRYGPDFRLAVLFSSRLVALGS